MNEWLNIMLGEIDRKKKEEQAAKEENERRAEELPPSSKCKAMQKKATRNSA